jgi:hypothetical protein
LFLIPALAQSAIKNPEMSIPKNKVLKGIALI